MRPVVLVVLCAGLAVAQFPADSDISAIYDLINRGDYAEAFRRFDALSRVPPMVRSFPDLHSIRTYYGRACLETGNLKEAEAALKAAAEQRADLVDLYTFPIACRELAALHLARRDYAAAAREASRVTRLVRDSRSYTPSAAYARSIEAIARLRMGDLSRATELITKALKVVPRRDKRTFPLAARTLYAACIIEAHRGNHALADEHCRRGIAFITAAGVVSRDTVLGNLAVAEALLVAGKPLEGRSGARAAMHLTARLFGTRHQDAVRAAELIALAELALGNTEAAVKSAREALQFAESVFGAGSTAVAAVEASLARTLGN